MKSSLVYEQVHCLWAVRLVIPYVCMGNYLHKGYGYSICGYVELICKLYESHLLQLWNSSKKWVETESKGWMYSYAEYECIHMQIKDTTETYHFMHLKIRYCDPRDLGKRRWWCSLLCHRIEDPWMLWAGSGCCVIVRSCGRGRKYSKGRRERFSCTNRVVCGEKKSNGRTYSCGFPYEYFLLGLFLFILPPSNPFSRHSYYDKQLKCINIFAFSCSKCSEPIIRARFSKHLGTFSFHLLYQKIGVNAIRTTGNSAPLNCVPHCLWLLKVHFFCTCCPFCHVRALEWTNIHFCWNHFFCLLSFYRIFCEDLGILLALPANSMYCPCWYPGNMTWIEPFAQC